MPRKIKCKAATTKEEIHKLGLGWSRAKYRPMPRCKIHKCELYQAHIHKNGEEIEIGLWCELGDNGTGQLIIPKMVPKPDYSA